MPRFVQSELRENMLWVLRSNWWFSAILQLDWADTCTQPDHLLRRILTSYRDQMVWAWEKNGYKNSTGKVRVNASLIQQLHEPLLSLESMGPAVKFWGVSPQVTGILKARKLCNLVLMAKPGVDNEAFDFLEHSSSLDEMDID